MGNCSGSKTRTVLSSDFVSSLTLDGACVAAVADADVAVSRGIVAGT